MWTYGLETCGNMTGFVLDTKYKEGTSGTADYRRSVEHDSATLMPETDVTIVRPLIDVEKAYYTAADYDQTSHSFTPYSGDAAHHG